MSSYNITHEHCDADALPAERTGVASLDRDQFYKICPGTHRDADGAYAPLGQPRCGDGTNFSFLVTRPKEPRVREKIVVELSGGGACWDDLTCKLQGIFLTWPGWYDAMVGKSCSELSTSLCSKTVGGVDFAEYTYVAIPYCTQDVHLGDAPNVTYDGSSTIRHVGAHNLYRTLQWIFENFPNPSDIFLTGCSAGGTPLPVVYDLINTHYNDALGGEQAVNIDVISDSPVFLTPSYFLENYFPNWNARTITEKIGFDFDSFQYDTDFPHKILDHALENSKDTDSFGVVTHDGDQISLSYYSLMNGGSLESLFGRDRELLSSRSVDLQHMDEFAGRKLNSEVQDEWWSKLNRTMTEAMNEHSNFDMFVMDGDGHCNFGLNVPLSYSGFEDWAASIFEDDGEDDGVLPLDSPAELPTNVSTSSNDTSDIVAPTTTTETSTNMASRQTSPSLAITAVAVLTLRFFAAKIHR